MSSSANLATGQLKAFVDSQPQQYTYYAISSFGDTIHFVGLGNTPVPITLLMTVHGSSSGVVDGNSIGEAELRTGLQAAAADINANPLNANLVSITNTGFGGGTVTVISQDRTNIAFTLADTLTVSSFDPDLDFTASLAAEPATNGVTEVTSDFGHTATLAIVLPSGVTFTSDSGALLSQAPSAIPEPMSASLLTVAFAGIAAVRHRRKRN
jgi:hypothetical protein